MTIKPKNEFTEVQPLTDFFSNKWYQSLNPEKQCEALTECEAQLKALAKTTLVCGAIHFTHVQVESKSTQLYFISNRELLKLKELKLPSRLIVELPLPNAAFYLLYDQCFHHIQVSSNSTEIVRFGSREGHEWKTSTASIKQMAKQNWDKSLVIAKNLSRSEIIIEDEIKECLS